MSNALTATQTPSRMQNRNVLRFGVFWQRLILNRAARRRRRRLHTERVVRKHGLHNPIHWGTCVRASEQFVLLNQPARLHGRISRLVFVGVCVKGEGDQSVDSGSDASHENLLR